MITLTSYAAVRNLYNGNTSKYTRHRTVSALCLWTADSWKEMMPSLNDSSG